jgi:cell division inhibitor SepF
MSIGDVWHRTLVYFGIAEEYDDGWDDDDYGSDELPSHATQHAEPAYAERSGANVRRLPRRPSSHDYDDWTSGEAPAAEPAAPSRPGPQVVPPPDRFKQSMPVIVNLQDADVDLSKRLIDFASGLTYALNGTMQRIADKVFLLTPPNIVVSAEERAKVLERGGFFNRA